MGISTEGYFFEKGILRKIDWVKPLPMSKRALVLIIVVQFVLMIMFFAYAMVQRTSAIKNEQRAIEQAEIAKQNEMRVIAAQQEAIKQAERAQKALEEYTRSK